MCTNNYENAKKKTVGSPGPVRGWGVGRGRQLVGSKVGGSG